MYKILDKILLMFESFGKYISLISNIFRSYNSWGLYISNSIDQMIIIGTKSIPIVVLTSFFTGMVSSVQAGYQMESSITPKWVVGSLVGETMLLELAPVITCLVLAGRIGATIAAELGTMRVTEQIDALESLSLDPIAYLVFPRMLAALIMFPVLTIIADIFGITGGIIAAISTLDIDSYQFMKGLKTWFKPWDAWYGIIKGLSFGLAITSISCYCGFYARGGAEGVGKATTASVVNSCIAIMILDYVLASILL
jgi:phospholipid/cholesterol/gamma-HCH transport system permease protein